jgi:NADH:ubiquinone oxidoreductase subunit 6 (subunit J)
MTSALIAIAAVTLATAAIAMMLRNIIHSALLLIGSWAGIAAFYLWAGAEFVGFAQLMVYVGAVSRCCSRSTPRPMCGTPPAPARASWPP